MVERPSYNNGKGVKILKNTIIESARSRHKKITDLIAKTELKVRHTPPGRLRIDTKRGTPYYYHVTGGKSVILSLSDLPLIRSLAQKAYYKKILSSAKKEISALEKCINEYPEIPVEKIYEMLSPERRALIDPIWKPDEEFAAEWLARPFTPKGFKEGAPMFISTTGIRVRSKSELIIIERLIAKQIPFRYECPLQLRSRTIHPDFTILRLSDRKELYLEHLGRMDDPDYEDDLAKRINEYYKAGIYPNDRLYFTFESSRTQLDVALIDRFIEDNFR